ncbi:DNA cytosine methyltransferase [Gallaecimonas xiamenensis]|uniref:DNA (cytosine-5-)-methyltransferase n=1 Tax=Gallaecimonas xiamenensis 3-C-1 TaxID=745411 RepID=K2KJE1_9GAMM|nr:DNA cytosine methyltransferase [Gallaecimonas xiamenensis]EKE77440.1 DNA-cytosine methyltransferase [Gallaecimonas xiamenensis 3-C-1]
MHQQIPVIDIFAGPGGLAEGFSSFQTEGEETYPFKIVMSAEKDESACATLKLRAFLRWFTYGRKHKQLPRVYVDYVKAKDKGLVREPAMLLGRLLELSPSCDSFAELEKIRDSEGRLTALDALLLREFAEEWEVFCYSINYGKEKREILEALWHAIQEARCIELGGSNDEETILFRPLSARLSEHEKSHEGVNHAVLIGGPPCQAYSNVGRIRRTKGNVVNNIRTAGEKWTLMDDPRSWLYLEYLKILDRTSPAIFVMENVKGMLSAKFENENGDVELVWKRIVQDLHSPHEAIDKSTRTDYQPTSDKQYMICSLVDAEKCHFNGSPEELENLDPKDFVIKASDYGVPQHRERVILLGIRKDLIGKIDLKDLLSQIKMEKSKKTDVLEAISDIPPHRSYLTGLFTPERKRPLHVRNDKENSPKWQRALSEQTEAIKSRISVIIDECMSCNDNDRAELYGDIKDILESAHKAQRHSDFNNGYAWVEAPPKSFSETHLNTWCRGKWPDYELLNSDPRGHMDTDLGRYVFAACYAIAVRKMYAKGKKQFREQIDLDELEKVGLLPAHNNRKSFIDRFKVQRAEHPASTITSHISKDGHYFIHPDPGQCRSFTVREAARIQTFPDDYFFEGSKVQQYVQVGNAVPPLLANKIGEVVFRVFESLKLTFPFNVK